MDTLTNKYPRANSTASCLRHKKEHVPIRGMRFRMVWMLCMAPRASNRAVRFGPMLARPSEPRNTLKKTLVTAPTLLT